jgi:hypothetical protein
MNNYNPSNWYWAVGGSTSQVWSSAAAAYVPATDATYAAWLAAGNAPTPIDSEASLATVLQAAYPAGLGALQADAPAVLDFDGFMALFTSAEQAAIMTSTDAQTRIFVAMAGGSARISLASPEVIAGVNYLATSTTATPPGPGLIAATRPAQILANQPPSS